MGFPAHHPAKLHSTEPIERPNVEFERCSEVVCIFPNAEAVTRLIGTLPLKQNDEWAAQRARCISLETIARSAIVPSSACLLRQAERAASAAVSNPPTPRNGA